MNSRLAQFASGLNTELCVTKAAAMKAHVAHLIAQFESSSAEIEKFMRVKKAIEADELKRMETECRLMLKK